MSETYIDLNRPLPVDWFAALAKQMRAVRCWFL
jgi:hypothetical protein